MKEIVILVLSISMVSALAGTANAMRSFFDSIDAQETSLVSVEDECELSPIVYDQPPGDEEDWPGCRD